MDKDTELARMEHKMNTYWAEIEEAFLCNEDGFDDFFVSLRLTKLLLDVANFPTNDPIRLLLRWAGLRMVREARERDLIPEQEGA